MKFYSTGRFGLVRSKTSLVSYYAFSASCVQKAQGRVLNVRGRLAETLAKIYSDLECCFEVLS